MEILRAYFCVGVATVIIGCGQKSASPTSESSFTPPTVSIPNPTTDDQSKDENSRLHQPFSDAVIEDCPGDQQLPPDRTMAGLSTAKVASRSRKSGTRFGFSTSKGSPSATWRASTPTSAASACNSNRRSRRTTPQLRRLAQAGYYNGLIFEHLIQQEGERPRIEAGTDRRRLPARHRRTGHRPLGYWLKPEFSESVKHEPGTFGACTTTDPDTAGCRFYVTLSKRPGHGRQFHGVRQGEDRAGRGSYNSQTAESRRLDAARQAG